MTRRVALHEVVRFRLIFVLLVFVAALTAITASMVQRSPPLLRASASSTAMTSTVRAYDLTRNNVRAYRGFAADRVVASAAVRCATSDQALPSRVALLVAAETEPGLANDLAQACSANSFTAATPVLLASGTETAISTVRIGDKVLATDPQTGRTAARPVTGIIVHSGKHTMVDVTLADGSKLTGTDHHPFWDATTSSFTYAIDLHAGDRVREADGTQLTITAIHAYPEDVTAYNLTVDGIHTYYAGTTPVLVHNSCGNPIEGVPRSGSGLKVDVGGNIETGGTIYPEGGRPVIREFAPQPLAHGFPDVVDNFAGSATQFPIRSGADLYQLGGSFNGVEGRFEWIVDQGAVTHRMFVGGGAINGIPIVP